MRSTAPLAEGHEPWRQGYRLGASARLATPRPNGPIANLERLLLDLGVHVSEVELADPGLEAASIWEPGAVPLVLLNARAPRAQGIARRLVMAHELCHLLHDCGENDLVTQLTWHHGESHGGSVEQRARAFAPAFLAPCGEVQQWFRRGPGKRIDDPRRKVMRLAERWGFSFEGSVWHAKNCRIISALTAQALSRTVPEETCGWCGAFERDRPSAIRKARLGDEEVEVGPLARGLIAELASRAADSGLISTGRTREIFAWGLS